MLIILIINFIYGILYVLFLMEKNTIVININNFLLNYLISKIV